MKNLLFFPLCIAGLVLLAGCLPKSHDGSDFVAFHEVRDGFGRMVSVPERPIRVYASTSNLEDLSLALVGAERMAAVREDSTMEDSLFREEALRVATRLPSEVSAEQVVALRPDVVILQEREAEVRTLLEEMGLVVFSVPVATNRELIEERILSVSNALGEREKGENMLDSFRKKLMLAKEHTAHMPMAERPIAVAYTASGGAFGTSEGLVQSLFTDAGLQNVAAVAGVKRGETVSKEIVVDVRPDYFVLPITRRIVGNRMSADELEAHMRSDPAYEGIPAMEEGHIIHILNGYLNCTSHRYADGVLYLHNAIYGDRKMYDREREGRN